MSGGIFTAQVAKTLYCDPQRLPCRFGKLPKSFSSEALTLSIFLGNFANVVIVLFANVDLRSTASTSCDPNLDVI